MDKLIKNSTAEFLIFTSKNNEDSIELKVVCRDFRHTEKSLDTSVSSKIEPTCKKILQVPYIRG